MPRRSAAGHRSSTQLPKSAAAARMASAVISGWRDAPDCPLHSRVPAAAPEREPRRRRRLKHPCQPIVFCQSLRDLLRRRGIGQTDGDQQCSNTTKDWRGNSHERRSQLHRRSRLPACSICSCPMGHLLCYRILILGLPRTIKPAAARVISSLAVPLAVPYRMRPAATRSRQFDAAIFRRAHARFVPNRTKIWATKASHVQSPSPSANGTL